MKFKNDFFIPAISIHSPYSTHPSLAYFALDLAKKQNLLASTHFLESKAENIWLRESKGVLKNGLKISHFILSLFIHQRILLNFLKE